MRSGTAILDIAPSFDTFIDGLSVDPDYVLGVKWLRKLSRLPPNILLTSNGRSSAGQDVEAQFCVSGKARTLREPDDVTKFRSSLNVKENRRMMTLMPRREFLQAGAGAAWAIAHPAWATWSGTVNAIRPPGKEFLATLPHLMELAKLPGLGMGVVEGGKMAWQHYSG